MQQSSVYLGFFICVLLGLLFWIEQKRRVLSLENHSLKQEIKKAQEIAQEKEKMKNEEIAFYKEAQNQMRDSFKALSSDSLEKAQEHFLKMAKQSMSHFNEKAENNLSKQQKEMENALKPVRETMNLVEKSIREIEKERKGSEQGLKTQLEQMMQVEKELRLETSQLSKALKNPVSRGKWGEIQLRRVVELSGMLKHCDFTEQKARQQEEGVVKPDLVVHLPGDKHIVIDAKTPLDSYMEAVNAKDEVFEQKIHKHAQQLKAHILSLSKKKYWTYFESSPEFVILFLPSEAILSAAVSQNPDLIEMGAENKVMLATPTTLIALLKAISFGWRQEAISKNAEEISKLGGLLYKRISNLAAYWQRLGKHLGQAVDSYNQAVGNLETRVLVSARKFKDLGAYGQSTLEIDPTEPLDQVPREFQAEELIEDRNG